MSEIEKRIENLSEEELELLIHHTKKKRGQIIHPRRRNNHSFPLSFAQQQLWFLDQLTPSSSLYTIPIALRLRGCLEVTVLEQSFIELISRHESLRTNFVVIEGTPVQVITPVLMLQTPVLSFIDLHTLSEDQQQIEIQNFCDNEAQRPFDLAHDLLIRTTLLHLGENEHVLFLVIHHITADAWSMNILYHELSLLYNTFLRKQNSPLSPLSIQYPDFAQWQRQWLRGKTLERQLTYWREYLRGVPMLEMPIDHPRPAIQSFQGASYTPPSLPKLLVEQLKVLSQKENVTLFMILLAAFQILLMRYSNQEDITVGSPFSNRPQKELERLIGFFVTMLVLRSDLSGNPSFKEVLQRVRRITLDAYTNRDLSFERLVRELQPERTPNNNPLYQVVFQFLSASQEVFALEGIIVQPLVVSNGAVKFDLDFAIIETEQGLLQCTMNYKRELFAEETIERMMNHFQVLLEELVSNPEQQIWNFPLLNKAEFQQMIIQWNDTTTEYPKEQCIHQLFEAQVLQTPKSIAVISGELQVTYEELNQQANRIAHYLRTLGVGPETHVGICMDRSLDLVTGLLAILKAGGAYVAIDRSYPRERLIYMLEYAEVSLLLIHQRFIQTNIVPGIKVVDLDDIRDLITSQRQKNLKSDVEPNNLAYIMYTSGSTGKPKGICTTHKNVVRLVKQNNYVSISENEVFLLFAPVTFDASTFELWGCLLNGARLVLSPPYLLSLHELGELLIQHHVTTLWLTAGLFHQMVEVNPEGLRYVQQLLAGGDVLSISHVQKFLKEFERCKLVNGYGPTEGTTFTCCNVMTTSSLYDISVPIGRPITNTEVYILDAYLQPVPVGVAGELYIGGDGLARGYLKRPDLTAESFIPHPFSKVVGARLYRSGDLARYKSDGMIEFLGRRDAQVKIRGFRIELGEIEAILEQNSSIQDAIILIREDASSIKYLIAYVVPRQSQMLSEDELHRYLEEKLPPYMRPSVLVFLDELPLTVNGKLDRQALYRMPMPQTTSKVIYVPPRTPTEEKLAEIWKKVLNIERVGIHENFFEVGGDSLFSIRVIALAHQEGVNITAVQMLQHQTIAELADVIAPMLQIGAEQGLIEGPVPFTGSQAHFFNELHSFNPNHSNGVMLLKTFQPLDFMLVKQTIHHLYRHHDALRLRFVQEGIGWRQFMIGDEDLEPIPTTWLDVSVLTESEQIAILETIVSQLNTKLHLSNGPLTSVAYFNFGDQRPGRLLWVMHHLVTDGFSMDILAQDFQTVYQQLIHGQEPHLSLKTTSFKALAEHQHVLAKSAVFQRELEEYWLKLPWERVVPLPLDNPEGKRFDTLASSRTVEAMLSAEETRTLLERVISPDIRIMEVLLTALAWVCTSWTGSPLTYVRVIEHGRDIFDEMDLSRTVGYIAYGNRLLLDIEKASEVAEVLPLIKEQLRRVPNRGIGYSLLSRLSEDEQIKRRMQIVPRFREINFNYINYVGYTGSILPEAPFFEVAQEKKGPTRGLQEYRDCTLGCVCIITDDQLRIQWEYGENIHHHSTIQALARAYIETLNILINYLS